MDSEQVWSGFIEGLRAFLRAKVSNSADVEDLLQDILIKAHQNLPHLKAKGSLKPWLFQIAKHAVIDFYRARHQSGDINVQDFRLARNSPDLPAAQQELSRCVEPFIRTLPKKEAQLLIAIDLQGQSQKDYAKKLGIGYSTLKSRVQKSRRELRKLFEDCCHLSFDIQGNIADFDPKSGDCKTC